MSKDYLKKFVQFKTKCIAAFGKCRKHEDVVAEVVGVCIRDPVKVIRDLNITKRNLDSALQVKQKMTMVLKGRKVLKRSQETMSCSDFSKKVVAFLQAFTTNFYNPEVSTMADEVINATVVACTDADRESLTAAEQDLEDTISDANEYITVNQASLSGNFKMFLASSTILLMFVT